MSVLVYEPPGEVAIEALEDELARAYEVMRAAVARGDAVVVSLDETYAEVYAKLVARVPAGRAAEVADVVTYLASERASYITGQMLLACGGRSVAG
jgi:NAD(P)-dependent dehydrogenase (short-subunit alcohol dehydrogenase family)